MNKIVKLERLKHISFSEAWQYQTNIFNKLLKDKLEDNNDRSNYLLFCEHPHVYTLGKSGNIDNLLINKRLRDEKGIEFFEIDRGGDITYHGPGQIVVYPIFDLEIFNIGIKEYIYKLEQIVIDTLLYFRIKSSRLNNAVGVWIEANNKTNARKICAIGVKASRYITMHGFAFNVNTDLSYFTFINPCGFIDKGVTSIEKELSKTLNLKDVESVIINNFKKEFNFTAMN